MHKPLRPDWALEVENWLNARGMFKSELARATNINYGMMVNTLNGFTNSPKIKARVLEYIAEQDA